MKRKRNQIGALTLAIVAALFFALPLRAQVTIGSQQTPDVNALLDFRQGTGSDSTSTKGLLLPRVELSSTTDASPLTAHVKGMFVYNTATAVDVKPGIYYNDGSKWVAAASGQSSAPAASSRLLIKELSTAGSYPISAADDNYLIVTYAATVFTFPNLDAADAGITVRIMNYSQDLNSYNGPINSATTASGSGGIFIWTGKIWVALSKQ